MFFLDPQSVCQSVSNLVEALAARGELEEVDLLLALAAHRQHLAVRELLPAHRLDAVGGEFHAVAQLAGALGAVARFYLRRPYLFGLNNIFVTYIIE